MTKYLKVILYFILLFSLFSSGKVLCANPDYMIKPRIISAPDGDTIKIWTRERPISVRLTGIDCYETSVNGHIYYQRNKGLSDEEIIERGLKAKEELLKILRGHKDIYLELTGLDKKWGRFVGEFYYRDKDGSFVSINERLMAIGYCPKYVFVPRNQFKN